MKTHKMLEIITEAVIKDQMIQFMEDMGVKAYTLESHLSGRGARGVRDDGVMLWENIKISVITTADLAEEIGNAVANKFLKHYAGIIYTLDVETLYQEIAK